MSSYYEYEYNLSEVQRNLVDIDRVGKNTSDRLEEQGYECLNDFEDMNPTVLYNQIDMISMSTAISIVKQANPDRFEPF